MAYKYTDIAFLGQGWSFPPEFEKRSKKVKMVAAEQDIRESLLILLSTTPGERVMQPDYGCGLHALVFETIDVTFETRIRDTVERAVLFFEPRIVLHTVEADSTDSLEGIIRIKLDYTLISTNTRTNLVYPFYFKEATNAEL